MKRQIIILFFIGSTLGFAISKDKHGKLYEGGRVMYSSISIYLNDDSTYYTSEWMHPAVFRKDTGTWSHSNGNSIILNSKSKTCRTPCRDSSWMDYRFVNQKCTLTDSTLYLIPEEDEDKDFYIDYFHLYLKKEY